MKLTYEEMDAYIKVAWIQVEHGKEYQYRFGQALYNLLPNYVTHQIYMTEFDFFYWTDYNKVLEVAYNQLCKE